jgi:YHS domain-containing protein
MPSMMSMLVNARAFIHHAASAAIEGPSRNASAMPSSSRAESPSARAGAAETAKVKHWRSRRDFTLGGLYRVQNRAVCRYKCAMAPSNLPTISTAVFTAILSLPLAPNAQDVKPPAAPPAVAERTDTAPSELRRQSFNVDKDGLALQGYDPISYLDKAGPKEGKKEHAIVHRGITYRFVSAENKAKFESDPARYEPPFGGWCAWAVIDGDKVEIDPTNYEVIDGRVYLFYKGWLGNAKKKWDDKLKADGAKKTVGAADSGWKKLADADKAAYEAERKGRK